jgi:tRNA-Thr(GGU) m(6)t(6)A37 methyltransferase TsaA
MKPQLTVIGTIRSPLKTIEDCPLQEFENAPPATLEIDPQFAEASKDLKVGDEITILTWLHLGDRSVLTTHPRNDPNSKITGVFSTRSPDRPNPIGLHAGTIQKVISTGVFEISALEVLDNTPVIDVKIALK